MPDYTTRRAFTAPKALHCRDCTSRPEWWSVLTQQSQVGQAKRARGGLDRPTHSARSHPPRRAVRRPPAVSRSAPLAASVGSSARDVSNSRMRQQQRPVVILRPSQYIIPPTGGRDIVSSAREGCAPVDAPVAPQHDSQDGRRAVCLPPGVLQRAVGDQ